MNEIRQLQEWFKNTYEKDMFRLSMGEIGPDMAGFDTLLGFFGQGVALLALIDPRYAIMLPEVHDHMNKMVTKLKKAGFEDKAYFSYALILGMVAERAMEAIVHVDKNSPRGES